MDSDEFHRLVLIGIAEIVATLGDMAYPGPVKGIGSNNRAVANELRAAAGGVNAEEDSRS